METENKTAETKKTPEENKKRIENHKKVADHLNAASKHHLDAAKHHEDNNDDKAAKSTLIAQGHLILANEAHREETKKYAGYPVI